MRQADEAEFRDFVVARWPRLVRTAYLLTGDRQYAEDLAQSALTRAYQGWGRVRAAENPDAYVHRILLRCNATRFRKNRVAEQLTETPGEPSPGGAADASEQVAQRWALVEALQDLPAKQRVIVVLRFWSDLSERDTAEVVGCSVGTVKSQTHRALGRLRQHPALAGAVGSGVSHG